jgi:hypothetical protein
MPNLKIFRGAFVDGLRANIGANCSKYSRDDRWVLEIGTARSRDIETGVNLASGIDLIAPENDDLKDQENAIQLHRALRSLTPLQARDPRLWARIAHVEAWAYMRRRWPVERFEADRAKASRFIESRYFVAQSQSRALLRNGIARLWWTAHLSHDASRSNPYELTNVLFSTLDITQQILERNLGRSLAVLTGFLEFMLRREALLLTGGDQNRVRIRRLAKFLNMYGGVCLLDSLSQGEIVELLGRHLEVILAGEPPKPAAKTESHD